jgi:uncharacterized membrane protein
MMTGRSSLGVRDLSLLSVVPLHCFDRLWYWSDAMPIRTAFLIAFMTTGLLAANIEAQTYTAVAYRYGTIAYPGALSTTANGINNNNVIVGSYFDSNSSVHGFIYRDGKYTRVDVPGSTDTEIHGINDQGDIVGVYQTAGPLNFHGFLGHHGDFITIDDPQATFGTTIFGINSRLEIVGTFDDSQAFILKNGAFKNYSVSQESAGPSQIQFNGVNNLGWIAGQELVDGTWRGFWLSGKDQDFLQPASANDNQVTGINARGDIVGCHDAVSGFVSFRVEAGERGEKTEQFPPQQKLTSCAAAINYSRIIIGNYFHIGRLNAFVAVPQMTLNVIAPPPHTSVANPVHLVASAMGLNPIWKIQVWTNFKQEFHVNGGHLDASLDLPLGTNQRLVIQAIDSKGVRAKVVTTITIQ